MKRPLRGAMTHYRRGDPESGFGLLLLIVLGALLAAGVVLVVRGGL